MKLIEKQWQYGTYLAYEDVDEKYLPTIQGTRVLPAPFFYEKRLYFELYRRYEPGEKSTFPNGGYEVRDMSGGIRSYDLDQVIIHPFVIKQKKIAERTSRRIEKEQKVRDRQAKKRIKEAQEPKPTSGKRGRPALDPAIKAAREAEKAAKAVKSGGKRGRPKSSEPKQVKPKTTGGKRGRPALSPEAKAQKLASKAAVSARSGGRRGRPPKVKR